MNPNDYHIYACLPFVDLGHQTIIEMGPVIFWPSSKYTEFLETGLHKDFLEYFDTIGRVHAHVEHPGEQPNEYIQTTKITPQAATCISIHKDVGSDKIQNLLIDALHLLYFACTFRNLYFNVEIPRFRPFTKFIPCYETFIKNREMWTDVRILETKRENTICIHMADKEICQALGAALQGTISDEKTEYHEDYMRLVRSVRYFGDRFYEKFVNLLSIGFHLSPRLFEPEDVLFLASSFDSLLNITEKFPAADFKEKVRPMLHLRYNEPVELFWKWADEFYRLRRVIVQGGRLPDQNFIANPNFQTSFVYLGIKLFIYTVYYTLFKHSLLPSDIPDYYVPPKFKWIQPEEVLLFYWSETGILNKLSVLLLQVKVSEDPMEIISEITLLSSIYATMLKRYAFDSDYAGDAVKFIPALDEKIMAPIRSILDHAAGDIDIADKHVSLVEFFPHDFLSLVNKRLKH